VVTTAPDRSRPKSASNDAKRPARPARPDRLDKSVGPSTREPLDKAAWQKAFMLLNVALIAGVAIVGLRYLQKDEPSDRAVTSGPAEVTWSATEDPTTGSTASDVATAGTTTGGGTTTEPTPATTNPDVGEEAAPRVPRTMDVDFAAGDGWLVGAGFRETGSMAWPLEVVDRLMTHGEPQGPTVVSWLEKWNKTDVRLLGARILFAPNHSGAAALTAWHTSILDTSGLEQPRTGMRLVATPGRWRLVAIDARGTVTIATGRYQQEGHSATFTLVRRDSTLWVTDPTGLVTRVTDPRVGSLSGPWASWELRDDRVGKRPAGFQEIWAG
jgi:hypothetical protein